MRKPANRVSVRSGARTRANPSKIASGPGSSATAQQEAQSAQLDEMLMLAGLWNLITASERNVEDRLEAVALLHELVRRSTREGKSVVFGAEEYTVAFMPNGGKAPQG